MAYKRSKTRFNTSRMYDEIIAARRAVIDRVRTAADNYRVRFIRAIEDQKFTSFYEYPLSEKWLQTKEREGADERVHIATGHYVASIRCYHQRYETTHVSYIGFGKQDMAVNLKGEKTQMPLRVLARILEFGSETRNLPPRAHWIPFYEWMRSDVNNNRDLYRRAAYNAVKKTRRR